MKKIIEGKAYVLGDDIDTEITLLGQPFVKEGRTESEYRIIVGGRNFGCGSSREHAPACLDIAGIEAVVAESYARIFYRNSVDGGFFIPFESPVPLVQEIKTGLRKIWESMDQWTMKSLGEVIEIIEAGDIFAYARKTGMIPG